jgi:hypothetical protein
VKQPNGWKITVRDCDDLRLIFSPDEPERFSCGVRAVSAAATWTSQTAPDRESPHDCLCRADARKKTIDVWNLKLPICNQAKRGVCLSL